MAEDAPPRTTRDAFLGGRLILEQPVRGHRSGTDAVLLAAAVPRDFAGRVHDVGAGVGAVGLAIAARCPGATVTLVEKDEAHAALARANAGANGLDGRVAVVVRDVLSDAARRASAAPADLVVTNPPFYRAADVRGSPDPVRRTAHVMAVAHGHGDWLLACLELLDVKGTLIALHHAAAVPELLDGLRRRAGEITLLSVHPRAGEPAVRVLLRARKGSRAPFRIAPPLVLHDGAGFTPVAAALHGGTALVDW